MRERPSAAVRRSWLLPPLLCTVLLAGCNRAVLNPAGDIALQQRDIIYVSTALMLLIIVPVLALIVTFAWRYRQANRDATYDPHFDHSTGLELAIWSAPLLIIICLGALTWWSTHLLDPFRPLNRVSATKPVDPNMKPLIVQVVSLDWKWLFIYPEQQIATVNELALPVDRPVRFDLTSTNMMNTFYAPTMAGMIYVMPGMRSTLNAVINRPGAFDGMSANYSGAGFSDMRFKLYGVSQRGFDGWVGRVKAGGRRLDTAGFLALEKPSEKVQPMYFGTVEPTLFDRVYNRCVRPGTPCMSDVMRRDMMRDDRHPHAMGSGPGKAPGSPAPPQHGRRQEGASSKDAGGDPSGVRPRGNDASAGADARSLRNREMSVLSSPAPGAARARAA